MALNAMPVRTIRAPRAASPLASPVSRQRPSIIYQTPGTPGSPTLVQMALPFARPAVQAAPVSVASWPSPTASSPGRLLRRVIPLRAPSSASGVLPPPPPAPEGETGCWMWVSEEPDSPPIVLPVGTEGPYLGPDAVTRLVSPRLRVERGTPLGQHRIRPLDPSRIKHQGETLLGQKVSKELDETLKDRQPLFLEAIHLHSPLTEARISRNQAVPEARSRAVPEVQRQAVPEPQVVLPIPTPEVGHERAVPRSRVDTRPVVGRYSPTTLQRGPVGASSSSWGDGTNGRSQSKTRDEAMPFFPPVPEPAAVDSSRLSESKLLLAPKPRSKEPSQLQSATAVAASVLGSYRSRESYQTPFLPSGTPVSYRAAGTGSPPMPMPTASSEHTLHQSEDPFPSQEGPGNFRLIDSAYPRMVAPPTTESMVGEPPVIDAALEPAPVIQWEEPAQQPPRATWEESAPPAARFYGQDLDTTAGFGFSSGLGASSAPAPEEDWWSRRGEPERGRMVGDIGAWPSEAWKSGVSEVMASYRQLKSSPQNQERQTQQAVSPSRLSGLRLIGDD